MPNHSIAVTCSKHLILIPRKIFPKIVHLVGPVRLKVYLIQPFAEHSTHATSYSSPPFPHWFLEPLSWRGTHVVSYSFPLSRCSSLQAVDMVVFIYMVLYIYLVAICVYACTWSMYVCYTLLSAVRPSPGVSIFSSRAGNS